jgi:hypothetical protein
VAFALLIGSVSFACEKPAARSDAMTTTAAAATAAKTGTDLETLERAVSLPRRPRAAQWRKALRGTVGLGPTDWQLVAVLEYSPEDSAALLATLTSTRLTSSIGDDDGWLPAATRVALKDAPAFEATPFFKSPLLQGTLFHLPGTTTFVLVLFTT